MAAKYHDTFYHGYFYHIFNRSNNQEIIFKTERNYVFFLERWQKYLAAFLNVYSYCLMPTHFHFFARVKEMAGIDTVADPQRIRNPYGAGQPDINQILERQFQLFFRSYAHAFNQENSRTGSLFQKRFKRIRVDDPRCFTTVIHYIHHNPIHHHCVDAYEKWKFSSYNAMLRDQPTQVMRDEVLKWFGSKQDFIQFHRGDVNFDKIKPYIERMTTLDSDDS